MIAHDFAVGYDVFKFRRFRLNVLSFLRLPLDTSELVLRQAIKECSTGLWIDYLWRSDLARSAMDATTVRWAPAQKAAPQHMAGRVKEIGGVSAA